VLYSHKYRTADALVKDFELMKNNAVRFNGAETPISAEAVEIFKFVKDQVEASRSEFNPLEEEVEELMSGKLAKQQKSKKKKSLIIKSKKSNISGGTPTGSMASMIGDISQDILDNDGDSDSDSDDDLDLDL
jgi:Bromodomain